MQEYDFVHDPMNAIVNYLTATWVKETEIDWK